MLHFPDFTARRIDVGAGIHIQAQIGGSGPPLLLLHGHPQTHALWHRVAPTLAQHFTVVATDLRGYGDSSKPTPDAEHLNHSKRAMAADQVAVMHTLSHTTFSVLAHDRGARVAHRLALDHPQAVQRLVLLDIAPTLAMYEATNRAFATAYFHWFWHIQPAPLPETLIGAAPAFYIRSLMGNRPSGLAAFAPEALAEYERCIALPGAVASLCEDYRASASIDLVHDREDLAAGRRLSLPLQVLWGRHGVIEQCFDPLALWREVASDPTQVQGQALPCAHYVAEEAPEALLQSALPFLRGL
jgi:haloacetate dehalogenase